MVPGWVPGSAMAFVRRAGPITWTSEPVTLREFPSAKQRGSHRIPAHVTLRNWHHQHLLSYQSYWLYPYPTFFLSMKELECTSHTISVILQAVVYEDLKFFFFFPFHNEEGHEMAFQKSMRENASVLSSGNS